MLYPGLPDHRYYPRVQRLLGGQASGVVTFELTGGAPAAEMMFQVCMLSHPCMPWHRFCLLHCVVWSSLPSRLAARLYHDQIALLEGSEQEHDSACVQALKIPLVAPSLGAVESLITRPATTTHVGMSQEERQVCHLPSCLLHCQAKRR